MSFRLFRRQTLASPTFPQRFSVCARVVPARTRGPSERVFHRRSERPETREEARSLQIVGEHRRPRYRVA